MNRIKRFTNVKKIPLGPTYYLASPYSSPVPFIRYLRYELTIHLGSVLTNMGHKLIEPIAMCHEQGERYDLPTGYAFWQTRDRTLVGLSAGVIVLKMPGWDTSVGVTDEIAHARSLGKPVYILDIKKMLDPRIFKEFQELANIPGGKANAIHKAVTTRSNKQH